MGGCLNTSDKWLWGSGEAPLCTSLQQAEEGLKRWALRREGGCSQRLADGRALLCLPLHLVWSGLREAQCSGVPTRGQHTAALWLFYSLEELSWVPLAPPQPPASFLSHFSEPITPQLRSFHPDPSVQDEAASQPASLTSLLSWGIPQPSSLPSRMSSGWAAERASCCPSPAAIQRKVSGLVSRGNGRVRRFTPSNKFSHMC